MLRKTKTILKCKSVSLYYSSDKGACEILRTYQYFSEVYSFRITIKLN